MCTPCISHHPIAFYTHTIHTHIQKQTRVRIWLYEETKLQIEGVIIGFDEYMNMVLDDAVEISKSAGRVEVGRLLLKGDAVTLLQYVSFVRSFVGGSGAA